jgi:hypothetical protein
MKKYLFLFISILLFIIIIGYLYTSIYILKSYWIKEKYENSMNTINYLSKEDSQQFIMNDIDNYIKNMTKYDLYARKVKDGNEYINKIVYGCLDFTELQKEKLDRCIKKAEKYFNNGYTWNLSQIDYVYEEGFPHTRGTIIFLSPAIINYNDDELTKTLIHESIHIYQRFNKKEVNDYLKKYGIQISRKKGTQEDDKLIRANPDLDEYIYMDDKGNEMIAYYNSEKPNGIGDIYLTNLSNEHPYEKMAYEFADNYYKSLLVKYKDV